MGRALTRSGARCTIAAMSAEHRIVTLLTVGGLDPTGGAGILVDAAAARSLGLHVAAATAVITVQDGQSFAKMRVESADIVRDTVAAALGSLTVGAVKTGALGNGAVVSVIAELADRGGFPPLIVDPVIRSSSGGELLDEAGIGVLRDELMPRAALITPNADEAAVLAGMPVGSQAAAVEAGERLVAAGARAVLIKGGHLPGQAVEDLLFVPGARPHRLRTDRLKGPIPRGTGCALASLVAGHMALGAGLELAVDQARGDLGQALERCVRVGAGPPVLRFGESADRV
jgi:hydroxymethylpyrimidine/phosphomethylpyrimidine kinase